jgi:hypothetical protein
MSTSQIALIRLAQAEDEYVPGTLNPRQYQGLAQVWRSGSTFADEVYNPTAKDQQVANKAMALLEDWEDWNDWGTAIGYTEGQAVGLEKVGDTGGQASQPAQPFTSTSVASHPALAVRLSPVKPKKRAALTASQLEEAPLSQVYNSDDSIWQQEFTEGLGQDQEGPTTQEHIELSE